MALSRPQAPTSSTIIEARSVADVFREGPVGRAWFACTGTIRAPSRTSMCAAPYTQVSDRRRQLMLIGLLRVGPVGDNQGRRVDRRLRIVALDEAVLGFHDAAFGIGEVLLRFGVWLFAWRGGGLSPGCRRLLDYVLTRPIVSAGMIAEELRITPRAAQDLVAELGLREATGRGRYRAWGSKALSAARRHGADAGSRVRSSSAPGRGGFPRRAAPDRARAPD